MAIVTCAVVSVFFFLLVLSTSWYCWQNFSHSFLHRPCLQSGASPTSGAYAFTTIALECFDRNFTLIILSLMGFLPIIAFAAYFPSIFPTLLKCSSPVRSRGMSFRHVLYGAIPGRTLPPVTLTSLPSSMLLSGCLDVCSDEGCVKYMGLVFFGSRMMCCISNIHNMIMCKDLSSFFILFSRFQS